LAGVVAGFVAAAGAGAAAAAGAVVTEKLLLPPAEFDVTAGAFAPVPPFNELMIPKPADSTE
jgi:hypothetical protein